MDLNFGKYAFFIWVSYGATFLVLAGLTADSLLRARKWRREAERLEAAKQAHKAAAKAAAK
jgi:heme exporter protein D